MNAIDDTAHSVKGATWLVSYPKSGNTWVRWFLSSYLRAGSPVSINSALATVSPASRALVDEWLGMDSADLTEEEQGRFRPVALQRMISAASTPVYFKVHESRQCRLSGTSLVSPAPAHRVVLIVRDPRDVAVSLAHYLGAPIQVGVDLLCSEEHAYTFRGQSMTTSLPYHIGSWTSHTRSWLAASPAPLLVRYEDLLSASESSFARIVRYLELPFDSEVLSRTLDSTSFSRAATEERQSGFLEAMPGRAFFRVGKCRSWKAELPAVSVRQIEACHGLLMKELNYDLD